MNPLDLLPNLASVLMIGRESSLTPPIRAVTPSGTSGKLDTDGWSVWKVSYIKYEGEGVVGYITNNLKNGHLRNLDDHFRKYALAAYGVIG